MLGKGAAIWIKAHCHNIRRCYPKMNSQTSSSMNLSTDMQSVLTTMSKVYGDPPSVSSSTWRPLPYAESKPRYLWTDAYGVCNYITLYKESGSTMFLDMADSLIEDVHNTLGRHRGGGARLGDSTKEEPLKGGLRIGKEDDEGQPDGDGQYFHYLTKWMFALNRMSIVRDEEHYNDLAIQLAKAVHPHFAYNRDRDRPRMYWKMSIDLSKPWVPSEGNLDPFDGYMTYRLLDHRSSRLKGALDTEISDMWKMVKNKYSSYRSQDPLDLGETLWICHWFLEEDGLGREEWAVKVSNIALQMLELLYETGHFTSFGLAFREFGTTIGVQVNQLASPAWRKRVNEINTYWSNKLFSRDNDITPVMYCTSLNPGAVRNRYL